MLGWESDWPRLSPGPDKPEKKKACCEGKEAPADKGGKGTLISIGSKPSATPAGWAGRADRRPGELAAGCWEPAAQRSLCPPLRVSKLAGAGTGPSAWALQSHWSSSTIIPSSSGILEPLTGPESHHQPEESQAGSWFSALSSRFSPSAFLTQVCQNLMLSSEEAGIHSEHRNPVDPAHHVPGRFSRLSDLVFPGPLRWAGLYRSSFIDEETET